MSCCPPKRIAATDRFFSKQARRYLKRFKRKGLEKSQRQLVEGIEQAGINGKSVLEIGCGVGYLHQQLIDRGASGATGVDISEGMLNQAKDYAAELGRGEITDYHLGDFREHAPDMKKVDVSVLDKVICCYADMPGLLADTLGKTRQVIGYTLPRRAWWFTPIFKMVAVILGWLPGFRPYFHEPEEVRRIVEAEGFKLVYANFALAWHTQVFARGASR